MLIRKSLRSPDGIVRSFSVFLAALIVFAGMATNAAAQYGKPLSPTQLDKVVGPVALYPDPLLAAVLSASIYPDQISQAALWVQVNADKSKLEEQPWDPSVVTVAKYPPVLTKMNREASWTMKLGTAFLSQQSDVLQSVQRLRKKAQLLGNLSSTPQQKVIVTGSTIQILPADPSIIYVPEYTTVIYTKRAPNPAVPLLAFALGVAVGNSQDSHHYHYYYPTLDWHGRTVVYTGHAGSAWGAAYSHAGPRGYGTTYRAGGTGIHGNDWNAAASHGRTWNGGAYQASARSREWENGATTGRYQASVVGPNGTAHASGAGYSNDDLKAGTYSRTGTTRAGGAYSVSASGVKTDDGGRGSVTVSGVNRQGEYKSKTVTNNNGLRTSSTTSGTLFGGGQTRTQAVAYSNRGAFSRQASYPAARPAFRGRRR